MKSFKKLALVLSAATVAFISCKNSDSPANIDTTKTLLLNVWLVDSIATHYHTSIKDTSATYLGQPSDYFDFNANSNLYQQINNSKDTSVYNIVNSNTVIITHKDGGQNTATITTLTSKKLVATSKQILNATDYIEVKSYLEH
ncbi:MAG: hypothetical protein ABIP30_02435 [Ferruginibacter sp.]